MITQTPWLAGLRLRLTFHRGPLEGVAFTPAPVAIPAPAGAHMEAPAPAPPAPPLGQGVLSATLEASDRSNIDRDVRPCSFIA